MVRSDQRVQDQQTNDQRLVRTARHNSQGPLLPYTAAPGHGISNPEKNTFRHAAGKAGDPYQSVPCPDGIMLGELSGVSKLYLICGRTDMRLSINGLMAIIRDTYQMDPYANALYLFCGRKHDRLKAPRHDKTGFVLLWKITPSC